MEFDRSAKMYSAVLFCVTTLFVVLAFFNQLNQVTGGLLIALFTAYLVSIGYAIYKGVVEPPELSDSDSDSDSHDELPITSDERPIGQRPASEESPLLGHANQQEADNKEPSRPLYQHILQLIFGLLALTLSGYILAHSAGAITDALGLSGTVFGLTVIAFATTLPEKFISVLSGFRGEAGIIVATTAGSNIFLLTLCVGVVAVAGIPLNGEDTFVLFDLVSVWVSSLCFAAVVFLGPPSRITGLVFLAAYVAFLALEFTVYKR